MKILINALLLNDKFSGISHATQNLLTAISKSNCLQHDIEVLLSKNYSNYLEEKEHFKTKKLLFSTTNRAKRIYYEHFKLIQYYKKNKFDLYHSTNCIAPYFSAAPTLLTVHDLIALDYPELCKNKTAIYYKLFLPNSIMNAKKIIAVSEKIKEDIIKRFNIDPRKIEVIHHGVGKEFTKIKSPDILQKVVQKYQLPDKFILFVGNLEPRKNLDNLIEAFLELKKHANIEHKLVIAGTDGWKCENLYIKVRQVELDTEIIFTGYIDQEDIPALYSLSDLFVFPSLYEGFGLPVLEAMACQTPVLISNRGALPEIAGNVFPQVDPLDSRDIASKILTFITNHPLKTEVVNYGIDRIKQFTWEKAAHKTVAVYDQLLNC